MRKVQTPPIDISEMSDVGRRRYENQDSVARLQLTKIPYQGGHLLVVADGMGGASGGQVASRIAVQEIVSYFQDEPNMEPDVALREAIEQAASAILKKASEDPSLTGMGTTCVMGMVQNGYLFAAHVGDSRMYLWRKGKLHRMTRDHSAVQRLVEAGILTEEEAKNHPRQNVLSRVLGSEFPLYVEVMAPPWKLLEGDRILLASDGLHGEVEDEDIQHILANAKTAQEAVETLVNTANENGGNDNVTTQVLFYGPIPTDNNESPSPQTTLPTNNPPPPSQESWQSLADRPESYFFYALLILLPFFLGYMAGRYDNKKIYTASYTNHEHPNDIRVRPLPRSILIDPELIPPNHRDDLPPNHRDDLPATQPATQPAPIERTVPTTPTAPIKHTTAPIERTVPLERTAPIERTAPSAPTAPIERATAPTTQPTERTIAPSSKPVAPAVRTTAPTSRPASRTTPLR